MAKLCLKLIANKILRIKNKVLKIIYFTIIHKIFKIHMFERNQKGFSLVEISVVILIIGILISGISQAFDMMDEANLKGARAASKGSRAPRIKDLVLWLDATADGASLTSADKQGVEGDDVAKWKDSNPNSTAGFVFTGTAPKYNATKVSGLPGISFDSASSNYLKLTSKFDNSPVDYTIYLVYQPLNTSASVIMEKRNAAQGASFPYKLEIESGFYKFSDSVGSVVGVKKPSVGKVNLIRLSRSIGGALTIAVDDVTTAGSGGTAVNSEELIIGAKNATTIGNFIKGRIGELIIFERDLNTSEEVDIEKYLNKKWKIEKDSSKSSMCAVTTLNAGVATISVGSNVSVACASGYTGTVVANCSAAPALTYTVVSGSCAQGCLISSDIFTTSSTMAVGASAVIATCKIGGARNVTCPSAGNPTFTACSSGS